MFDFGNEETALHIATPPKIGLPCQHLSAYRITRCVTEEPQVAVNAAHVAVEKLDSVHRCPTLDNAPTKALYFCNTVVKTGDCSVREIASTWLDNLPDKLYSLCYMLEIELVVMQFQCKVFREPLRGFLVQVDDEPFVSTNDRPIVNETHVAGSSPITFAYYVLIKEREIEIGKDLRCDVTYR